MQFTSPDPIHPKLNDLELFLQDQLAEVESERINQHVEHCLDCQRHLAAICEAPDVSLVNLNNLIPTEPETGLKTKLTRFDLPRVSVSTDRYSIGEEIARGGMGVVYRAHDHELNRELAIKVLSIGADKKSEQAEARFEREARICGQLQHPGIVPIHELGRLPDGRVFIAMKLIEGQTLKHVVSKNFNNGPASLNLSQLLEVFHQVCQTMAFAHSKGVIHRDLKPDNIMVGAFGEVQIMDWGLAKRMEHDNIEPSILDNEPPSTLSKKSAQCTTQGAVLGTPAFMSPEQALGVQADRRSDVFSLGGILCEILTGQPPFSESTATGAMELAKAGNLNPAKGRLKQCDASPELVELALGCISEDPAERPADAGEVADQMERFLNSQQERLRNAELLRVRSETKLAVERKRRQQTLLLGTMIVATTLFCAIASLLYFHERSNRQAETLNRRLTQQAEIDRVETEIKGLLNEAVTFQDKATMASLENQRDLNLWNDALVAIKQADTLLSSSVDSDLAARIAKTKSDIESAVLNSQQAIENQARETKMLAAIESARRYSFSLEYARNEKDHLRELNTIQTAFREYFGIKLDDDVQAAKTIIRTSSIREALMDGLLSWEKMTNHVRPTNDHQQWFQDVWYATDTNRYRKKLRRTIDQKNQQAFLNVKRNLNATKNMVCVRMIVDELTRLGESQKTTLAAFLRSVRYKHPESFEINLRLGIHCISKGGSSDLEEAKGYLRACRALRPDHPAPMQHIADIHELKGAFFAAVIDNEKVRELSPNDLTPIVNIARIYQKAQNFPNSLEASEEILAVDPHHPDALRIKGDSLMSIKKYAEANQVFSKLSKRNPKDADAQSLLAISFVRLGELSSAELALTKVPAQQDKRRLSMQARAELAAAQGMQKESLELFEELVKKHPGDATYLAFCSALIENDELDRASVEMKRFKKRFDDKNLYKRKLSELLEAQGDMVGARAALKGMKLKAPPEVALRRRIRFLDEKIKNLPESTIR